MLKNSQLFPLIFLITIFSVCSADRTVAQEEYLIHELPCVYRGEVWSVLYSDPTKTDYYFLDNDRAYLGAHTYSPSIGRVDKWMVWAEFDISTLAGKKIADIGFRVFNSGTGTEITDLAYSTVQPDGSTAQQLYDSYDYTRDSYAGFSWDINPDGAWTPGSDSFFLPGSENWNTWKRNSTASLIEDMQAHIDSDTSWFAVVFSKFTENPDTTPNLNLIFDTAAADPQSIIMQVTVAEGAVREKNLGNCPGSCGTCPANGEPINMATGNEHHQDTDLILHGPGLPMAFQRHYNSQQESDSPLGYGWASTFSEKITVDSGVIKLRQADGNEVHFIDDGSGAYISQADKKRVIEPITGGYRLREPDGRVFTFDDTGVLTLIEDRNGNSQTLTYDSGRLAAVEDNFGRQFTFTYDGNGKLDTLTTPAGQFDYDVTDGNLSRVTKPDTAFREYQYNDINDLHNLTGIVNENSTLFATFDYDDQDRAVSAEHAGGMFGIDVAYGSSGINTATDSLGQVTSFTTQVGHGIARVTDTTGTGCGTCATSLKSSYTLDDRLRVAEETDPEGNRTAYTYDDRGNILTVTEAVATPEERLTAYTWHPDFDLLTSITQGNRVTTLTRDSSNGNLLELREEGPSLSRTVSFTYNSYGWLTSVDGPRTDVNDVTTFTYYNNLAANGLNRGQLHQVINALGHTITYSNYNGFGRPTTVFDANSVATTYLYDTAGRLTSKTRSGHTTSYAYDDAGNLTELHLPGNVDIFYAYTDADLLEKITDNQGNYIRYFYDTEGNRVREEIRDAGGDLKKYIDFEFDDYNLLAKIINLSSHETVLEYDDNQNPLRRTEPDNDVVDYGYDVLDRLVSVTRAAAVTGYEYNQYDDVTGITDPKGHATTYIRDDFGRVATVGSPDTGSTSYTYDAADNPVTVDDPRPNTTGYSYDALNRLTGISFADPSENMTYGYDAGIYGKGRLTSMTDPAGSTGYVYNNLGQLTQESRIMNGVTYTTEYSYDNDFNLESVTYPSGLVVTYTRDNTGRITGTAADTETITSQAAHLPFGPVEDMTFGSSVLNISRTYDQRYLLSQNNAGAVFDHGYTRDGEGKVTAVSGVEDTLPAAGTTAYTHTANRLAESTGAEPAQYSYDNVGNIISDGTRTFTYNQNNRLSRVSEGTTTVAEYGYDGQGRRVFKTVSGITTHYHYDPSGNLIAETTATGTSLRDIIYQDGERIAMKVYGAKRRNLLVHQRSSRRTQGRHQ